MAISMSFSSSAWDLGRSRNLKNISRHSARFKLHSLQGWACDRKKIFVDNPSLSLSGQKRCTNDVRGSEVSLAEDSDDMASAESSISTSTDSEAAATGNQVASPDVQTAMNGAGKALASADDSAPKRSPSTVREKVRAARLISKYSESKPSKQEFGSKVLDALRESDKGKKRSGLPEAPTNLFDDSTRGMPKQGLTFDFPGGRDLLIIIFSFVFISTVMLGTTFIVWKSGAIHFNEY